MERVTVEIDPNVRIEDNRTFSRLRDVSGAITLNRSVVAVESDAGLVGEGTVASIDLVRGFVVLDVDWTSLRPREL